MTKDTMTSFNFNSMDVKVITKNNDHWFVLIDVCKILEISNPWDAFSNLDDDEKSGLVIFDSYGRQYPTMVINKKGLYRLVLRSRKPEAEQFNKWITSEVLPSLNHRPTLGNKDMKNGSSTTQQSMNNNPNALIIANITIKQDSEGRYCLNDCHKASGMGASKKPSEWLRNNQTTQLITEIFQSGNTLFDRKQPFLKENINPVNIVKGGNNPGTYAAKELVYAYAMWISPSFNLQVIRAYDDLVEGRYQPVVDLNDPEFLRNTLLTYTEKCISLENENKELKPKADGYDRIASSDGAVYITNAAKDLQIRPTDLFNYLSSNKWIYRRFVKGNWIAYQDKIKLGYLEHKITEIVGNGNTKFIEQVRITNKGLIKLSDLLNNHETIIPNEYKAWCEIGRKVR